MKNKLFPLLFVCMGVHIYAQSDVATARWMQQPAIIDGVNTEWGSLNFYDDQTRLSFGIANDSNNIYLCFESTDELNQMKLMRAGMKITLEAKGKSKHEASVLFPLPQPKQLQTTDSVNNQNNVAVYKHPVYNKASFRQNFISNHSIMQVSGFANINGNVPTKDSSIQAAINWDTASNLLYEIAIAKKEFFGAGYSAKDATADITLSVEVNALQHVEGESRNGGSYHGGGGMHEGGGMNNGGGMHNGSGMHSGDMSGGEHDNENEGGSGGERTSMNNANSASLNTKTSFKQKFILNNNNN